MTLPNQTIPHLTQVQRVEEDIPTLYHRLYLARALAERMRDNDHNTDISNNNSLRYTHYTRWEHVCSAMSACYREEDVIYSGGSSAYASYLVAGGFPSYGNIIASAENNNGIYACPLPSGGASFFACSASKKAQKNITSGIISQKNGITFYTADITPENADDVTMTLEHAMYARKPLIAAVHFSVNSRETERTLARTVSRHAGAMMDIGNDTEPASFLKIINRLNQYIRAERMQALIIIRRTGTIPSLLFHERRKEDVLGYLTRILPDDLRRSIVYQVHEYLNDMHTPPIH